MKRPLIIETDAGESVCGACPHFYFSKRAASYAIQNPKNGFALCNVFPEVTYNAGGVKAHAARLRLSVNGDPLRSDDCLKSEQRARAALGALVEKSQTETSR